jgi:hypothetical protein
VRARPGDRVAHVLAGVALLVSALTLDPLLQRPFAIGKLQTVGIVLALALVAVGGFLREGRLAHLGAGACASFVALVVCLGSFELFFRAIGHDFLDWKKRQEQIAPFFVLPDEPIGDGLFKRRGPTSWTGQVLFTRLQQLGIQPNPYADEPTITVTYDAEGFRNPPDLQDWDIVVAGDSFTELGHLPQEALSTSVLARALGRRVKNLGASACATLTQLAYLERYGVAASTRDALLVFFEGNDLRELEQEFYAREVWRKTGESPFARPGPQTSLIVGLVEGLRRLRGQGRAVDVTDALFEGRSGKIPVTVMQTPTALATWTSEEQGRFASVLQRYAAFAADHHLRPWLVYLPCKLRVQREHLTFLARAKQRLSHWTPDELPHAVGEICAARGIFFVDATPALRAEAEASGELLYSSIYDTHLDARGAEVVGQAMARAIGSSSRP